MISELYHENDAVSCRRDVGVDVGGGRKKHKQKR